VWTSELQRLALARSPRRSTSTRRGRGRVGRLTGEQPAASECAWQAVPLPRPREGLRRRSGAVRAAAAAQAGVRAELRKSSPRSRTCRGDRRWTTSPSRQRAHTGRVEQLLTARHAGSRFAHLARPGEVPRQRRALHASIPRLVVVPTAAGHRRSIGRTPQHPSGRHAGSGAV